MSIANVIVLKSAKVPISFSRILGMLMRKSLTTDMATALTLAHKMNLEYSIDSYEAHVLAGGNIVDIVKTKVLLKLKNKAYSFQSLVAADLAGRPVFKLTEQYFEGVERDKYPEYESYLLKSELVEK